jgi:hypothetical protein
MSNVDGWGELIWGVGAVSVPALAALGAVAVLLALLAVGLLSRRRSLPLSWKVLMLTLAAAVPWIVHAAQIEAPHEFVNGTTADAIEVNENFAVLVDESNDQDDRLTALEGSPGIAGYEIRTLAFPGRSGPWGTNTQVGCPSDKVAVGGGYEIEGGGVSTVRLTRSAPAVDGSSWRFYIFVDFNTGTRDITLYAVCVLAS